jgi:hypothetical protein
VPWPPQGIYTKKEIQSVADMRGIKWRAYSTATAKIAELIGAQPVQIQAAELTQALATGVVESYMSSGSTGYDSKTYEHIKNWYDTQAWLPKNAVIINLKAYEALDKPTQAALLKAAADAETRGWKLSEEKNGWYVDQLKGKGMTMGRVLLILLMAGSDDLLLQRALSLFYKKGLGTVFFANLGSMGGLKSLRMGLCHIGTCHLLQDDNAEYNFDFADEELERAPVFVNFSKREQGILLQKGNPKGIGCIADLAKKGVRIVNRSLGTGTRLLLDYEIARSEISSDAIDGYHREVARHMDCPCWGVASGYN